MKGEPITQENHKIIIAWLKSKEAESSGVLKHDAEISFLRWWFE